MLSAHHAPISGSPRAVLVTGGAGFIGSRVVRRLLGAGMRVTVVDDLSAGRIERLEEHPSLTFVHGDVGTPGLLSAVLSYCGPFDRVLHLAARVGVRRVLADPEGCRAVHAAGVRALVEALGELRPRDCPRVFAASSSEVYSDAESPLAEDSAQRELGGAGRWAYAASKLAAELELDRALGTGDPNLAPVHLRFFNVVGPDQDSSSGMVLPTFLNQALEGGPITVHGDGRQVRTFAHVDEVADCLVAMLRRRSFPGGPLNVGGQACTTVLELARLVARAVEAGGSGAPGLDFVDPRRTVATSFEEVRHRRPDLGRLAALGLPVPQSDTEAIVTESLRQLGRTFFERPPIPLPHGRLRVGGLECASPGS